MPLFPSRFLRLRVAYEDLIFAALGLVLLLLGGFCLGVERGKRLATDGPVPIPTVPAVSPVAREELPAVAAALPVAPGQVERATVRISELSGIQYAIQLASYLDSKAAAAEAQRLTRRGFKAQVVRQGKYYELRVVGYRSREQAMTPLAALRRTYRDGFIKRLSSG